MNKALIVMSTAMTQGFNPPQLSENGRLQAHSIGLSFLGITSNNISFLCPEDSLASQQTAVIVAATSLGLMSGFKNAAVENEAEKVHTIDNADWLNANYHGNLSARLKELPDDCSAACLIIPSKMVSKLYHAIDPNRDTDLSSFSGAHGPDSLSGYASVLEFRTDTWANLGADNLRSLFAITPAGIENHAQSAKLVAELAHIIKEP